MRTEVLVKGPKGPMVFEEDIEGLATLPPSRVSATISAASSGRTSW